MKLKHFVLIGEMKYTSIKNACKKLGTMFYYADPTKLDFKLHDDKITVDDGEYKFTLNKKYIDSTVILIRSGYKCSNIRFFIKELIDMGFKVINDYNDVEISSNKYLISKLLDKYKLPQPKYILIEPSDINKGDTTILDIKLKTIYNKIEDNTKFVCKILSGHGGKGVFLCTKSNITSVLQCLFAIKDDINILVQEYIPIVDGDIRVHVITYKNKQKIIDSSLRKKSTNDFRTNLSLGNDQISDIELTKEQKELALNVAKASGLIWCGVDIISNKKGNYVIEYNGAPGPPTVLTQSQNELEESNELFFEKFLKTLSDILC